MNKNRIIKIFSITVLFLISLNFSFSQNLSGGNVSVNIEWQTIDSYTPTFYEGKALPGEESYIKALGIVNANSYSGSINPDNLFYAWKYNDYYVYNYSGTGMNTIYFTLDKLQPINTLELSVYSDSGQNTLLGTKTIKIRPNNSLPLLYKKNENSLITYSNAINKKYEDFKINPDESFKIIAEPFFFSAKNIADPVLSYSWTADGIFNGNNRSNIFNYFTGSVNSLNLKISNGQKILQEGETLVNFSTN